MSFVLSGVQMLLLTKVRSGLVFQHERGLVENISPARLSLLSQHLLTVGENG